MTIINCNSCNSLVLLRILLRPISTLDVRIINELVRRRCIQLLRRRTTRDRATTLAAQRVNCEPVTEEAIRNDRHALRLKISIPNVNDVGSVLRLDLTLRRLIRLVEISMVFFRARLVISILVFYRYVVSFLRALRRVFLRNLILIRQEVLERMTREMT